MPEPQETPEFQPLQLSHEELTTLLQLLRKAHTVMDNLSHHPALDTVPFVTRLRYRQKARACAEAVRTIQGMVFKLTEGKPILS